LEPGILAFEYRSEAGLIRLLKVGRRWRVALEPEIAGSWASPDQAAEAVAARSSGLSALDQANDLFVPAQLFNWTPTGQDL